MSTLENDIYECSMEMIGEGWWREIVVMMMVIDLGGITSRQQQQQRQQGFSDIIINPTEKEWRLEWEEYETIQRHNKMFISAVVLVALPSIIVAGRKKVVGHTNQLWYIVVGCCSRPLEIGGHGGLCARLSVVRCNLEIISTSAHKHTHTHTPSSLLFLFFFFFFFQLLI